MKQDWQIWSLLKLESRYLEVHYTFTSTFAFLHFYIKMYTVSMYAIIDFIVTSFYILLNSCFSLTLYETVSKNILAQMT